RCLAANPTPALWAHQPGFHPPAVSGALEGSRFDPREMEPPVRHEDGDREGATGQSLAIETMTGVDLQRRFGDLVSNFTAETAAGLRKLHIVSLNLLRPRRVP